ncbi:MAG: hypothetical protein JO131_00705 [Gammaproteobacteria bacterium]|nr:hypothetical protein [Gammaproteobacteria bacterium]
MIEPGRKPNENKTLSFYARTWLNNTQSYEQLKKMDPVTLKELIQKIDCVGETSTNAMKIINNNEVELIKGYQPNPRQSDSGPYSILKIVIDSEKWAKLLKIEQKAFDTVKSIYDIPYALRALDVQDIFSLRYISFTNIDRKLMLQSVKHFDEVTTYCNKLQEEMVNPNHISMRLRGKSNFVIGLFDKNDKRVDNDGKPIKSSTKVFSENEIFDTNLVKEIFKFY